MIFNVAGLLMDPIGAVRRHEVVDEILDTGYASFAGVSGPVKMMRTDSTVLVTAQIEAVTDAVCSRCLEPVTLPLTVELEEEFYPLNAELMGGGRQNGDDGLFDPSVAIDERNALDLSEALGQALAGSMPIAPLCDAGCAGICPTCSVNRNLTPCYCDQTPTDPRWAELARLVSGVANSQG